MKKYIAVVFLSMLSSAGLFGQAPLKAGFSPFPIWPADGNIPDNLKDHYVFLGPKVGQVTISYPASLEGVAPSQTGQKTYTFDLPNQVDPVFSVRISQDASGAYNYDYVLQNGESAKQAIKAWSLIGPANDPSFRVNRQGWSASKVNTTTARARQLELHNVSQVEVEVNFYGHPGNEIKPGSSLGGFHITSSYLPGFTTAFARGEENFVFPGELPTQVGDQVGILSRPEWNSQLRLILGPRYSAGFSKQSIAADLHYGISRLVRNGALSADSPFVKQALAALSNAIEAGDASALADQLRELPRPSTALENEIAAAMQLSLK